MPRSIKNPEGITLRKLINNTVMLKHNRIDYADRDVLRRIVIQKVSVYNGKDPGEARTKYVIKSFSYPQYYPYYTKTDNRGRPRTKQRTYKHEYTVTIQMDELSLDCDRIKLRTGADAKWDFSKEGQGHWEGTGRAKRYKEGTNVKRGLNGDFFFRLSYLYSESGILFGRNFANGFPKKTNPNGILFLDKHMFNTLRILVNRGIIQ